MFAPFYFMRISRVVGVDREKMRAWADERAKAREVARSRGLKEAFSTQAVNPDLLADWFKALP
jgi:hypothetical protein